jgi:hypothetical protein
VGSEGWRWRRMGGGRYFSMVTYGW